MADRAWLGLALGLTALTCQLSHAAGTDGANFLSIPVGGRPAALGGAYSALADDAYAPVWNPAGLGAVPSTQLTGMHLDYASAIGYEFFSAAHPLGAHDGLGAAVQYLHPKAATSRDANGAELGSFTSYYAAYSLAYGHAFNEAFSLGGAVKVVDARIADSSAHAPAGDLGALYRFGPRLTVAAVAANLGAKLKFIDEGQNLPDTYRLGAAFSPISPVSLSLETGYDRADSGFARVGGEWRPLAPIAVRVGYHSDGSSGVPGLTGLTTGVGLTALGQRFDYAWAPMGQFGDTQYFSLLLSFGGREGAAKTAASQRPLKTLTARE